ncbi:MAG: DUF1587 domain-containing protein [Pirellulaceae bacterium]
MAKQSLIKVAIRVSAFTIAVIFASLALDPVNAFGQQKGIDLQVKTLMEDNCFDCHSGTEPDAGLDLAHFATVESVQQASDIWEKVLRRLANGSMPPKEFGEMSDSDREVVGKWIDNTLHVVDCSDVRFAGQVTLRRLNRLEYRNSIRDLLGYDYEPADSFPGDDSGYGFDNIGDVLSLPPMLMEKYLTAAEQISKSIIVAPEDRVPIEIPIPISEWKTEGGIDTSRALSFYSRGLATWQPPSDSDENITLRIRARGDQAGADPVEMTIYRNSKQIKKVILREHDRLVTTDISVSVGKSKKPRLESALKTTFTIPMLLTHRNVTET